MIVLALTAALLGGSPPPAVREVRSAEAAFANAFAERDQQRFFRFVLDEATFLGGLRTLAGKQQVVARWSKFFESKEAPFSWAPERIVTNGAGTVGLSSGPVFGASGDHIGNFASVWVKQADGAWKVLFDGPGSAPGCLSSVEEGDVTLDDGATLHFHKAGDGPVTVIAPLDFVVFDFLKSLGDVATVISYDVRNRGRSSRAGDSTMLTIQQDVRDLEAIRAHFKIDRFVPVGYSYLGLMVVMYAREHPDRVERIVQLGPVPRRFDTAYPKALANTMDDVAAPEADVKKWREMQSAGAAEKSPKEFCEAQGRVFQYVLVGDPAHASRVKSHCDLENEWPVHLSRHLDSSFESVKKLDFPVAEVRKVAVPVLTIHGTKDRNAPYGGGREWAMTLPDARLVTIEGGAHQSWGDDPATVFAAIRAFVRGEWPLNAEKVTSLER